MFYVFVIAFSFMFCKNVSTQNSSTVTSKKTPEVVIFGPMLASMDLAPWFKKVAEWGADSYMCYSPHFRYGIHRANVETGRNNDKNQQGNHYGYHSDIMPLLGDLEPNIDEYINKEVLAYLDKSVLDSYELTRKNGMKFYYAFPFPLFPIQNQTVLQKLKPELFIDGKRPNLGNPFWGEYLQKVVRHLYKKMPEMAGIQLWFAEGAGQLYAFSDEDLAKFNVYMPPILKSFDKVCKELKITPIIFAHNYLHTNASRQKLHDIFPDFPGIVVMEDITWPEENCLMPFMGFMPPEQKEKLFAKNKIMSLSLLDAEYVGQGYFPVGFAKWWKQNSIESNKMGVDYLCGRTFFWDWGRSDKNFNRLNTQLFITLSKHPEKDPKEALSEAMRDFFGKNTPSRLVDIVFETEDIVKEVTSINGINPLSHSWFPLANYLDKDYFKGSRYMKAVDDLFEPAGTRVYPNLSDTLDAGGQWRFQLKTVTKSTEDYLSSKEKSIQWLQKTIPEVKTLTKGMKPEQVEMFNSGYKQLYDLARGMKCFIQISSIHYQWYRAKIINKQQAIDQMKPILNELTSVANEADNYPLGYKKDMLLFVEKVKNLQIKVQEIHKSN